MIKMTLNDFIEKLKECELKSTKKIDNRSKTEDIIDKIKNDKELEIILLNHNDKANKNCKEIIEKLDCCQNSLLIIIRDLNIKLNGNHTNSTEKSYFIRNSKDDENNKHLRTLYYQLNNIKLSIMQQSNQEKINEKKSIYKKCIAGLEDENKDSFNDTLFNKEKDRQINFEDKIKKLEQIININLNNTCYYNFNYFYDKLLDIDENKNNNNILKTFILSNINAENSLDCDASFESLQIYKELWKNALCYEGEKCEINKYSGYKYELKIGEVDNFIYYRGDTMTSPKTPLIKYLQSIDVELEGKTNIEKLKRLNKSNELNDINDSLSVECKEFLSMSHTIGNFIPVPQGFNNNRGGNYAEWDSWDLTLLAIYNYFCDYSEREKFKELLNKSNSPYLMMMGNNKKIAFNNFANWLELCGKSKTTNKNTQWDNFIENNYLQDFVYGNNYQSKPDKYGKPIMFFDGHSFKHHSPKSKEEFEQFFIRATAMIKLRCIRIFQALYEGEEKKNGNTN